MAKVLVVDDERVLTDAYHMVLERAGHEVYVANHPAAGLDLVKEKRPDIILLDMLMPDMNGVDFLKQLAKDDLLNKTTVLAFSNIENPEVMNAAKKLGAREYLLKVDYTPHQVVELVDRIMSNTSQHS